MVYDKVYILLCTLTSIEAGSRENQKILDSLHRPLKYHRLLVSPPCRHTKSEKLTFNSPPEVEGEHRSVETTLAESESTSSSAISFKFCQIRKHVLRMGVVIGEAKIYDENIRFSSPRHFLPRVCPSIY